MRARVKWLWIVTTTNLAVAAFLVWVVRTILWLAGIAAAVSISSWVYALLPIGVVLSVIGLRLAKNLPSIRARRLGYFLNACGLTPPVLVIIGIAALFLTVPEERFIIPDGYNGNIYVIYGAANGERQQRTLRRVIYRIPQSGILVTQAPMNRGLTRPTYFYEQSGGKLQRIRSNWPTTIQPTRENLTNEREIGVYFPRTGSLDEFGCSYEQFYIGTKAHLLTKYRKPDLFGYLHEHPAECKRE